MQTLNEALRPVAPPRVVEDVWSDDHHERLLGVIKQHGPWPTIMAHHFNTVDELIATVSGPMPDDPGITLDDVVTGSFRGFLAEGSVCFFDELHDCFYNPNLLGLVREYWGARYARPSLMLFNLCGPHHSGLTTHLDAVSFRGVTIENTPVWLLNIMGKSGLFVDHLVKMAQVITWWYRGENGTFTYWPDGPLGQPKRLEHPLWNKGIVVQNEIMFHRGDPVGRLDERDTPGLKHRSKLGYEPERDEWAITTDDEVIRRYHPEEMRLLVHWGAEVYDDMADVERSLEHSDDLSHEVVFERLLSDMRSNGVEVATPSDPMNDQDFIRSLLETYTIAPTTDWAEEGSA